MKSTETLKPNITVMDLPELRGLKVLYWIDLFLLVTDFLMPQYFGIDVGFDITCTRFANILIVIYLLFNPEILRVFFKNCFKTAATVPLMLYLIVALYTMVFRVDINAFMMVFLEILTMYMLYFGMRYVVGIKKSFKIIIFCAYFLCIYGLIEGIAGESFYLKYLKTVSTAVVNVYRSGSYRIMGPCGHPLGYGLVLLLFIPLSCINIEKKEIFLFSRPVLVLLLLVNVFLTGSRSTLAISGLEIVLLIATSNREQRRKSVFYCLSILIVFSVIVIALRNTKFGTYIMRQIASVIDLAFDTQLSVRYGAEVERLEDSEGYREFLPLVFTLDWLNPILGRGVKRGFGAEFIISDGTSVFIQSIDNYYVQQYIKYAYPGMITYCLFIISFVVDAVKDIILRKNKIFFAILIAFGCYFFNLWYLDALQTLKFVYVLVAFYYAYASALKIEVKETN